MTAKLNDTLNDEAGNDSLIGSGGNDLLTGGADIDTISYSTASGPVNVNLSAKKTTVTAVSTPSPPSRA